MIAVLNKGFQYGYVMQLLNLSYKKVTNKFLNRIEFNRVVF